jgi:hypothetical protein
MSTLFIDVNKLTISTIYDTINKHMEEKYLYLSLLLGPVVAFLLYKLGLELWCLAYAFIH